MEHQWLFFKHVIESDNYPDFTYTSANMALCNHDLDALVDMGGNRVSMPMLFTETTFKGTDPEEPTRS